MNRTKNILRTFVVIGVVGGLATLGAFSAFSSNTENPGNRVTAGNVNIADNDSGTALYFNTNAKPGAVQAAQCIRVNYTGSLDADVRLYTPDTIGALGQYVTLTVEPGTQAVPNINCTGFVADAGGAIFNDTLNDLPTTYLGGVQDYPGAVATEWVNGDAVVYRVTATLADNDAAEGLDTGAHALRWEARNQ